MAYADSLNNIDYPTSHRLCSGAWWVSSVSNPMFDSLVRHNNGANIIFSDGHLEWHDYDWCADRLYGNLFWHGIH
jgi:prepilin-type processing-associated H-X9-DG protein